MRFFSGFRPLTHPSRPGVDSSTQNHVPPLTWDHFKALVVKIGPPEVCKLKFFWNRMKIWGPLRPPNFRAFVAGVNDHLRWTTTHQINPHIKIFDSRGALTPVVEIAIP